MSHRGDSPASQKGSAMSDQIETVRQICRQFCLEFIQNPYLCYTEHGLHALFYTMLYNAMPGDRRYIVWHNHKVCVLQKEYPTARSLSKPRRQNWDIAVIKTPPQSRGDGMASSYDYLRLAAVVEVGLNEAEEHLRDDIERLSHPDANLDHGFIVHLYRLSEPGAKISQRDWSAASKRVIPRQSVAGRAEGKPVEVYYALYDCTGKHMPGVWFIRDGTIVPVEA
jgi:hypothetical protein